MNIAQGVTMEVISSLFTIGGSLGLFLFGMKTMSDGLQQAAGEKLQRVLNYMTINRFAGVLTGFLITALIQSSSATTVMVVSFVNAGLLNLVQSIGVIMGANIGTTVTGWIIAILGFKFSISSLALPAVGVGLILLYSKKLKKSEWGSVLIGFGLLFLGLSFLKDSVPNIKHHPEILQFLTHYTDLGFLSFLIFVVVGTLLTIVVQSSSAAMAITLTMTYAGWIDFNTAAAIILGENIGTTITAFLASLNTNIHARRAARAHMLFNVFGVLWMALLFIPFLHVVDLVVPGAPNTQMGIPAHLAMFHTLFNITNTLICLGMVPLYAKAVIFLIPAKDEKGEEEYSLQYLSTALQDTPEMNLYKAKAEISRMAEIIQTMFRDFSGLYHRRDITEEVKLEKNKEREEQTDVMQEEISQFLQACSYENLNEQSALNVNAMMRVVNELESIGDSCYNLMVLADRSRRKKRTLTSQGREDLSEYITLVDEFLGFITDHLNEHLSKEEFEKAYELEKQIDSFRNTLKKKARKRIQKGEDVKTELLYIDVVRHIERMGDYCLNIAQALRQIR